MSTSSSAAVASKRMEKTNPKKGHGGSHSNAGTSGATLKPVHPPKEPTMAEQAARLGLFT
jgi:hypothetical protein